jgi:DNA-directed RNA polymerase specialized sigma subunit
MSGADVEALISAGKRFMVMSGASNEKHSRDASTRSRKLLEALQHQALLNARLFSADRQKVLLGSADDMSAILLESNFTQKEVGDLLGKSQSAISRTQKTRPVPNVEGD